MGVANIAQRHSNNTHHGRLAVLSLDIMDISGELQRDISHNVMKVRLDKHGKQVPNSHSAELRNDLDKMNDAKQENYCGSCYGGLEPEGGCCNTCEDVRVAYVNRGWSFSNPEAIEQVRLASIALPLCLTKLHHSAKMKAGRTS